MKLGKKQIIQLIQNGHVDTQENSKKEIENSYQENNNLRKNTIIYKKTHINRQVSFSSINNINKNKSINYNTYNKISINNSNSKNNKSKNKMTLGEYFSFKNEDNDNLLSLNNNSINEEKTINNNNTILTNKSTPTNKITSNKITIETKDSIINKNNSKERALNTSNSNNNKRNNSKNNVDYKTKKEQNGSKSKQAFSTNLNSSNIDSNINNINLNTVITTDGSDINNYLKLDNNNKIINSLIQKLKEYKTTCKDVLTENAQLQQKIKEVSGKKINNNKYLCNTSPINKSRNRSINYNYNNNKANTKNLNNVDTAINYSSIVKNKTFEYNNPIKTGTSISVSYKSKSRNNSNISNKRDISKNFKNITKNFDLYNPTNTNSSIINISSINNNNNSNISKNLGNKQFKTYEKSNNYLYVKQISNNRISNNSMNNKELEGKSFIKNQINKFISYNDTTDLNEKKINKESSQPDNFLSTAFNNNRQRRLKVPNTVSNSNNSVCNHNSLLTSKSNNTEKIRYINNSYNLNRDTESKTTKNDTSVIKINNNDEIGSKTSNQSNIFLTYINERHNKINYTIKNNINKQASKSKPKSVYKGNIIDNISSSKNNNNNTNTLKYSNDLNLNLKNNKKSSEKNEKKNFKVFQSANLSTFDKSKSKYNINLKYNQLFLLEKYNIHNINTISNETKIEKFGGTFYRPPLTQKYADKYSSKFTTNTNSNKDKKNNNNAINSISSNSNMPSNLFHFKPKNKTMDLNNASNYNNSKEEEIEIVELMNNYNKLDKLPSSSVTSKESLKYNINKLQNINKNKGLLLIDSISSNKNNQVVYSKKICSSKRSFNN